MSFNGRGEFDYNKVIKVKGVWFQRGGETKILKVLLCLSCLIQWSGLEFIS